MANFFDKVAVGINKGVSAVSEGSKTLVEKAKLNTQIQDIEKEKEKIIHSLGNFVYKLQASGEISIEQIADMCNEITNANKQIESLQAQIQAIEDAKAQGTAYVPGTTPVVNTGAQCQCGFVNKEGAKFCAKCGTPLL